MIQCCEKIHFAFFHFQVGGECNTFQTRQLLTKTGERTEGRKRREEDDANGVSTRECSLLPSFHSKLAVKNSSKLQSPYVPLSGICRVFPFVRILRPNKVGMNGGTCETLIGKMECVAIFFSREMKWGESPRKTPVISFRWIGFQTHKSPFN